jgi:hypothetical protein
MYIYMHTIFTYIYSVEYVDFELKFVVSFTMATLVQKTELDFQL